MYEHSGDARGKREREENVQEVYEITIPQYLIIFIY